MIIMPTLSFPLVFVNIVVVVLIIALMSRPFQDWLYPCLFFIQVNDKQLLDTAVVCNTFL